MTEIVAARSGFGWGWASGEDGWKPGVDNNFRMNDTFNGLCIISDALTAPPGSPADGDTYIPAATATGAWATHEGKIASYQDGTWYFYPVAKGLRGLFINHSSSFFYNNGTTWVAEQSSASSIADGDVIANIAGSTAVAGATSLLSLLDHVISNTEGAVLARGTAWAEVAPGTPGQVFVTQGTTALPSWETIAFPTVGAGMLAGNPGTVTAVPSGITIGSGLTLSGSILSSSALGEALFWAGTWNASTNSPTLTSGAGTAGALYTVSTAGTTTVDGISQWNVGDKIAYDGVSSVWRKLDGEATEVTSVAGRTGAVVIAPSDISGLANGGTVDFTNAANITSGTLYAGLLPVFCSTPGTFGDVSHVAEFTVDQYGRIQNVVAVAIQYPPSLTLGGTTATAGNLLIANGSSWASTAMSGDGTINAGGTLVLNQASVVAKAQHTGTITATTTGTINPAGLDSVLINMGTTATTLTVSPGNPYQRLRLMVAQGATAHAVSFDNTVSFTADITAYTATTLVSKADLIEIFSNSTGSIWNFGAVNHGAVL